MPCRARPARNPAELGKRTGHKGRRLARVDRVTLHGDVELTKDKAGLLRARALKAIVDAVVKTLETEKHLPASVQVVRTKTVKNPFG